MINYNLEDYNDEFVNNNPFPHIYLDNFFDEDIIEEVYNEFPDEN